jgi:hypothetical protein
MVIKRSDRTVRGITAKELLHWPDLDDLKRHGFTLAQPIVIQISAKAARALILEIYTLGQNATIGFCHDRAGIWFRENLTNHLMEEDRLAPMPIEHLLETVVVRARQFAETIQAKLTKLQYMRIAGGEPCLRVWLAPAG